MLTKHHERKMPKNRGHIESLARSYTDTAVRVLAGIMNTETYPAMSPARYRVTKLGRVARSLGVRS